MLPREEAAAGLVAATAAFFTMVVFGFAPAFLTAISCFGAETGVVAFFADFLTDFLAVFFVAGFFAAFFFLAFLVIFFVFFAATLVFFARFFDAAVLAARCDTLFVFFFFEGFLPATTNSLITARRRLTGLILKRSAYRVASASIPNTEKTSGFRSRLYSAVSRAVRAIFSHTSASRARRGRLALASSARKRSLTQRSTPSMKAARATRSLIPIASPSACSSRGSTRGNVASRAAVRCCSFSASPPSSVR